MYYACGIVHKNKIKAAESSRQEAGDRWVEWNDTVSHEAGEQLKTNQRIRERWGTNKKKIMLRHDWGFSVLVALCPPRLHYVMCSCIQTSSIIYSILCNKCWLLKIKKMSEFFDRGLVQPVCLFSAVLIFAFKRCALYLNSTFWIHTLHVLICCKCYVV